MSIIMDLQDMKISVLCIHVIIISLLIAAFLGGEPISGKIQKKLSLHQKNGYR